MIMTIHSGNVDSGLTHWVGRLQGCMNQTLPPIFALVWLCRDRLPVDIAMDRVAILKSIQQEHPLRAVNSRKRSSRIAKGDPSWAIHGFCDTPDGHGIPERVPLDLDGTSLGANSPTRQPYESSPALSPLRP